jgi:hypothetical protein
VKVKVDPAMLKRYRSLVADIDRGARDESLGFDRYWEAVGEVIDKELYVAGGFATAAAFVAAVVKEPLRTVKRMVRVARYASPAEESRYHVAKIDAALGYIEAKTGGPVKGSLPVKFESLRIPVKRDGATHRVSLDDASIDEIRAATRELLKGSSRSRAKHSDAEDALVAKLKAEAALKGVSVHVFDGRVRFGEVPLGSLDAFVRALRQFKLPPAPGVK